MNTEVLQRALNIQRGAFRREGFPDVNVRHDRLDRLASMVLKHADDFVRTLSQDFGTRSAHATRVADVLGAISAVRFNREHVAKWMEPVPIQMPQAMTSQGGRAELRYVPLGVIGAIVPWNGPVLMSVLAAAGAFAAGNRLMLKVPEGTPQTSALLEKMFASHFSPEEAVVVQGEVDVSAAFSSLKFDHLIFTGSAAIARHVAQAAAQNLVPVTLELGGRNPVFIGRDADIELAARRITVGKMASAGQVCVSPDYVLVPRERLHELSAAIVRNAADFYPTLLGNDDATSIASVKHLQHLRGLLDDAKSKGAEVIEINPANEPLWSLEHRKVPLCLLLGVTAAMDVYHEETFGPILTLVPYDTFEEAIEEVQAQPQALSAYYFGHNDEERAVFLEQVEAGNVVVNDVRCQLFFEQLPFGGVGASGYGRYRGQAGFQTFSNAKSVVYQIDDDQSFAPQRPPYSDGVVATTLKLINEMRGFEPPTTD